MNQDCPLGVLFREGSQSVSMHDTRPKDGVCEGGDLGFGCWLLSLS